MRIASGGDLRFLLHHLQPRVFVRACRTLFKPGWDRPGFDAWGGATFHLRFETGDVQRVHVESQHVLGSQLYKQHYSVRTAARPSSQGRAK